MKMGFDEVEVFVELVTHTLVHFFDLGSLVPNGGQQ